MNPVLIPIAPVLLDDVTAHVTGSLELGKFSWSFQEIYPRAPRAEAMLCHHGEILGGRVGVGPPARRVDPRFDEAFLGALLVRAVNYGFRNIDDDAGRHPKEPESALEFSVVVKAEVCDGPERKADLFSESAAGSLPRNDSKIHESRFKVQGSSCRTSPQVWHRRTGIFLALDSTPQS